MSASMIEPPLFDGVIGSRDSVSGRFRKQVKMVSSVTGSMSPAAKQHWRAMRWPGSAGDHDSPLLGPALTRKRAADSLAAIGAHSGARELNTPQRPS